MGDCDVPAARGPLGHALGLIPKGRLFALTRDELIESMAVIRAVRQGILDKVCIPDAPLDILAQQIVAEVCGTRTGKPMICLPWSNELTHIGTCPGPSLMPSCIC